MAQREIAFLNWPRQGVVENAAFAQQNPETTLDALNVRNYDQFDRKLRGGQRTGLGKFIASRANNSKVQHMTSTLEAVALSEDAGYDTSTSDVTVASGGDRHVWRPGGGYAAILNSDSSTDSTISILAYDKAANTLTKTQELSTSRTLAGGIRWSPNGKYLVAGNTRFATELFVYEFDEGAETIAKVNDVTVSGSSVRHVLMSPLGDTIFWMDATSAATLHAIPFDQTDGTFGSEYSTLTPHDLRRYAIHPDGDEIFLFNDTRVNGVPWSTATGFGSVYASQVSDTDFDQGMPEKADIFFLSDTAVLFVVSFSSDPNTFIVAWEKGVGPTSTLDTDDMFSHVGFRTPEWLAVSPDASFLVCGATTGSDIVTKLIADQSSVGSVVTTPSESSPDYQNARINPDSDAVLIQYDATTANIQTWAPATENPSAREQRLITVQGGNIYRSDSPPTVLSAASGGSSVFDPASPVRSAPSFQRQFFANGEADGYVYLKYSDGSVNDWATDVTAGALPVGTNDATLACNMIALYRGRLVMSGLREEPQNWFMSRAGDPFDWDYSPATTSATQPVAGNNSDVGELGDIITALAPYNDDIMIMGGPNSLWVMRGDPAAGGAIDNITRQIGIVGPDAWTWDTSGNLYFFGANGLYRLQQGSGVPEHLSRNRLDKTFTEIDFSANFIFLVYDAIWIGVHIFVAPFSTPDTGPKHYFWDERNDAFWVDQYPASMSPFSVLQFFGNSPSDRVVLLGGYDGNIREFDDDAKDDDGTAITSRVRFAPVTPGNVLASGRMEDLTVVTDTASDDVQLDVYSGPTPEEANDAAAAATSPRLRRTITGGRNITIRNRIAQNTLIPVLSNDESGESWAFERAAASIEVLNRMKLKRVT